MLESMQEKLVAIMSIFSLLITTLYFMFRGKLLFADIDLRHDNQLIFMSGMITLIGIFAMIYNVGCVIRGGCTFWAWFLTLMVGISSILTILGISQLHDETMTDAVVQTVRVAQDNNLT